MFRRYHIIDRDQIGCDLLNAAFISSPSNTTSDLYAQYISNLSYVLDKHAPLKTKCLTKPKPVWITQQYREVKQFRSQAERTWRKNPSPFNRSKLRRRISKYNAIINKAKGNFYNSDDSKRL